MFPNTGILPLVFALTPVTFVSLSALAKVNESPAKTFWEELQLLGNLLPHREQGQAPSF